MYSLEKKYYGIFVIVVNQNKHSVEAASVVISLSAQVYEILPSQSVSKFDSQINKIKFDGQYALSATETLEESLNNISKDQSFYQEIEYYVIDKNVERLEPILKNFFSKVLEDDSVNLELAMEDTTVNELSTHTQSSQDEHTDSLNTIDISDPNTASEGFDQSVEEDFLLDLDLVLAPVGGRLVNKLKIGDKIMARIRPNKTPANHFINLYKLKDEGKQIIPIPVEVKSIKEVGKKIELLVKIDDHVPGKVVEEEKVLVKLFDPKKYKKFSKGFQSKVDDPLNAISKPGIGQKKPTTMEKKSSRIVIIGIVTTFILIFLLLAIVLD